MVRGCPYITSAARGGEGGKPNADRKYENNMKFREGLPSMMDKVLKKENT